MLQRLTSNADASSVPNFFGIVFALANRVPFTSIFAIIFFLFGTELFFVFSKDFSCNGRYILYNESTREKRRKKERKKMRNLIVLNTKAELIDFLNNTSMDTLVNSVAFASDLLEMVRENDNLVEINEDLGFCDDGGWIQIDEMGYVVKDFAIC